MNPNSSTTPAPAEKLLRPAEVAAELDLRPRAVYHMIRRGHLPAIDLGGYYRISRQDLNTFIASRRVTPNA